MKKKKVNLYNGIVYYFKVSCSLVLVFLVIGTISEFIDDRIAEYCLIFMLFFGINFFISMALLQKFGDKITIDIEKPKKPKCYKLKDSEEAISLIKKELLAQNYTTLQMTGVENIAYVHKLLKGPNTCYWDQQKIVIFYEFAEMDSKVVSFLKHQRKLIKEYYGKRDFSLDIMFLIKLEKENEYFENYIKQRVSQWQMNFYLEAFFIKNTLYISRPDMFDATHRQMKKWLLKSISKLIEKNKFRKRV